MYTGKLIDELIEAVQRAEMESKQLTVAPKSKQPGMMGMPMFMYQMQHTQRVRLGVA